MTIIAFSRAIGPVPITCVLSEKHTSEVEITGNPIETGAEVNDHAYVRPKQVVLEIADRNAALMYNVLVRFQESRVPFFLVTGLAVYRDMLIQSIDATRDKNNAAILKATVTCRQVIIVSTGSVQGDEPQLSGNPGGRDSLSAAWLKAANQTTATRAASTVQAGDNPTSTVSADQKWKVLRE